MARDPRLSHVIRHPDQPKKWLVLRTTTNPLDRVGTYAVMRVISNRGREEHYADLPIIKEVPTKVGYNAQEEPDFVIVGKSKERQRIDDPEVLQEASGEEEQTLEDVGEIVNKIAVLPEKPGESLERASRQLKVSRRVQESLSLKRSMLKKFLS